MRQQRAKLSKEENRRAWLLAVLIVLAMAAVVCALLPREIWHWGAVTIPETDARVLAASDGLDIIAVDLTFDPNALHQLTAVQTLQLTNRTGQTQSEVVLRSYTGTYLSSDTSPAAVDELFSACYGDTFHTGGLLVDSAQVGNTEVSYVWQDDARTVLSLSLAQAWQPDDTITVQLRWHAAVPRCGSRFGQQNGIWALGNLFPLPAVWEDGAYRTDAYISIGDPFLSECANWQVTLTAPANYTAAASGYTVPEQHGDTAVWQWEAQAVRDFALVLCADYHSESLMEGNTMIVAYATTAPGAKAMAQAAAKAIRCYTQQWGDYVYPTFTLCQVDFPFNGMEYPCLAMIGSDTVQTGGDMLALTVAHETAHQWWAMQVGSDSYYQAWQDESLAFYAQMDYIGQTTGTQAREEAILYNIEMALRITIPRGVTPGSPIDYFADLSEYSTVVYQRGAALWVALENLMGRDVLNEALRDYQDKYRFKIATRQDLTDVLSGYAGMDITALMVDYLDTEMN